MGQILSGHGNGHHLKHPQSESSEDAGFFFDTLEWYLQPDCTSTSTETAVKIDAYIKQKEADYFHTWGVSKMKGEGKLAEMEEILKSLMTDFWSTFVPVSYQISFNDPGQDRLVELIGALKKLPYHASQSSPDFSSVDQALWSEMPCLNDTIDDSYKKLPKPDRAFVRDQKRYENGIDMEWPNFQAMLAKLYRVHALDSKYIVWTMRDALEERPGHNDKKCGRGTQEGYVIAAANWIIYAGDSVRVAVRDRKLETTDSKVSEGEELFKGKTGMTVERWQFWQHRFETLGPSCKEPARSLSRKAAEEMKRLDTPST